MGNIKKTIGLVLLTAIISACSQEPVEVHYGADECAHCRMMITDQRFTSQIVTEKGKAYKFDAIECLLAFEKSSQKINGNVKYWISNFEKGGTWLDATSAYFIKSDVIKSPMGAGLLALPNAEAAGRHLNENAGKSAEWTLLMQGNFSY